MDKKRRRQGGYFLFIFTCIILILTSCALKPRSSRLLEERKELVELRKSLLHNRFKEVEEKALFLVKKYHGEPLIDECLFYLGLIYANPYNPGRDYKKAIKYFGDLVKKYPDSIWSYQARIWLNTLNFLEELKKLNIELESTKKKLLEERKELVELRKDLLHNRFKEAEERALALVKKYHGEPLIDECLFYLGLIYANPYNPGRDYKKAIKYFGDLVKKYPDSIWSYQARIWLNTLNFLEELKKLNIELESTK